jgi:hypothetical protein
MTEAQAGVLVAVAIYSAIELTILNWRLNRLRRFFEDRDEDRDRV